MIFLSGFLVLTYPKPIIGVYEALELRDGGSDYLGKGVSKVSVCYHDGDLS